MKIEVDGVSKRFGSDGTSALQDCRLQVRAEELLCVLGPSGCGKTTLLRIVDGLLRPDGGRVLIDGREVTAPRPDVALVFQHFGFCSHTCRNVCSGSRAGFAQHSPVSIRHSLDS